MLPIQVPEEFREVRNVLNLCPEEFWGVRIVLGLCCAKFGNSFPSILPLYFSQVSFLDWSDILLGGAGSFIVGFKFGHELAPLSMGLF